MRSSSSFSRRSFVSVLLAIVPMPLWAQSTAVNPEVVIIGAGSAGQAGLLKQRNFDYSAGYGCWRSISLRNASRKYHLAYILAIALASLWILNPAGNLESDKVSELLEKFPLDLGPLDSGVESESNLQQLATAPKLSELHFDRDAQAPAGGQSDVADLNLPDKVAVWCIL